MIHMLEAIAHPVDDHARNRHIEADADGEPGHDIRAGSPARVEIGEVEQERPGHAQPVTERIVRSHPDRVQPRRVPVSKGVMDEDVLRSMGIARTIVHPALAGVSLDHRDDDHIQYEGWTACASRRIATPDAIRRKF